MMFAAFLYHLDLRGFVNSKSDTCVCLLFKKEAISLTAQMLWLLLALYGCKLICSFGNNEVVN
jgi:hypothetical protein